MPDRLPTQFAPAERSGAEELRLQSEMFQRESFFIEVMRFLPDIVLILNENRQIVYANDTALSTARAPELLSALGLRPGEALRCKHAGTSEGGCGTTRFCRYCGAVNAVLKSQAGTKAVEECRITVDRNGQEEAMDLRVWACPFRSGNEIFTFFVAADIADEKRKHFLERIFLHDIMNTATALRGFSELVQGGFLADCDKADFLQRISLLSNRIIDEINAHRQLIAAESGELKTDFKELDSLVFLRDLFRSYNRPDILDQRRLALDESGAAAVLTTDATLLGRVVGNMTKNAIEASTPGETVTMGARVEGDRVAFWVHNPTYMPENIRLQVFQRSFSTKGAGRGLGTYSMKYLTEKYLGGSIGFTSTETEGTTFTAVYPLKPEEGK